MEERKLLSCPTEDIGYLIWRVIKLWQRGRFRVIDEFGLTVPQMEVLGAVYHLSFNEEDTTQVLLSQETGIDPMTTSTILRNLQKKSLVTRTESKVDTRARIVEITEEGKELLLKAIDKVESIQDEIYGGIDKKSLISQLQVLLKQLENYYK